MSGAAVADIDLTALRHNLSRVRALVPDGKILAVIKADAYGHGIVRAAQALADADAFAVARLCEAEALRAAGIKKTVVVLEGFLCMHELERMAELACEAVVHSDHQIELLEQARLADPIKVWIKIDTGMSRLGFEFERAESLWQRLGVCENVAGMRLMSHFANADDSAHERNAAQIALFEAACASFPGEKSLANSGAILGLPDSHLDWVRPGIMLYGVSPLLDKAAEELDLLPVMRLRSRLIAVNQQLAGAAVGYGGEWVCPEDMPVGVVAIGYGDGYPRHAISGTPVLVNGKRVHTIGRVSMDMICVDLREAADAKIGDEVILWGSPDLPVEEVAERAATIGYQLLCGVTPRVPRNYGEEG